MISRLVRLRSSRLVRVTDHDSYGAAYAYPADGLSLHVQQVGQADLGRRVLYDGDRVYAEYDEDWDLVARYTTEGPSYFDPLISMRRGEISRFYMTDQVGSVRNLTNSAQNVTDAYAYDAFGNLVASSGSTVNPYRYVGALGYYANSSTSLLHAGARYYGSGAGRFIQTDPMAYEYGSNLYSYAYQRPTSVVDPEGLGFWSWLWSHLSPRHGPRNPQGGGRARRPRTRPAARPRSPGGPGGSCPDKDPAIQWAKEQAYQLGWKIAQAATEEDLEGLKREVEVARKLASLPKNCRVAANTCLDRLSELRPDAGGLPDYALYFPNCVECCQLILGAAPAKGGPAYIGCLTGCDRGFPGPVQPNNPNRPRLNP